MRSAVGIVVIVVLFAHLSKREPQKRRNRLVVVGLAAAAVLVELLAHSGKPGERHCTALRRLVQGVVGQVVGGTDLIVTEILHQSAVLVIDVRDKHHVGLFDQDGRVHCVVLERDVVTGLRQIHVFHYL
ncbi:hypothetical protein ACS49_02635 [Bacillus cereus]|nr:hypothetical protein ACS49_02635 [Bacillus cereus]